MKLQSILAAGVMLLGTPALAELPNAHIVNTITSKAAFDRVWYATMQSVISANPETTATAKLEGPAPTILVSCSVGEDGDTFTVRELKAMRVKF